MSKTSDNSHHVKESLPAGSRTAERLLADVHVAGDARASGASSENHDNCRREHIDAQRQSLLKSLLSKTSTDKEKLRAVAALVRIGVREVLAHDGKGVTHSLRLEVEHLAGATLVHLFLKDGRGHEKTLLRGISTKDDDFSMERARDGKIVSFATADAKVLRLVNPARVETKTCASTKESGFIEAKQASVEQNVANSMGNANLSKISFKAQATGTAYYPASNSLEGGFKDKLGRPLFTLQDYLDGKAPYVSLAMDDQAGLKYGQKVYIEELDNKYGKKIECRIVDTGGAFHGKGTSRVDVCVADQDKANDEVLNGPLTLQFV